MPRNIPCSEISEWFACRTRSIIAILLVTIFAVGFSACSHLRAQEAIEMFHRWEFEPSLDCFRGVPEEDKLTIKMNRLQSPVEDYCLDEARKLLRTEDPIPESQRLESLKIAMEILSSKRGSRDLRLVMTSVVSKYAEADELNRLWEVAKDEAAIRFAAETGLASRSHLGPNEVWLERLRNPQSVALPELHLAIRGLAANQSDAALDPLTRMVVDDTLDYSTRLEAARSLAGRGQGLVELAESVLNTQEPGCEQIAVELLMAEGSDRAAEIMQGVFRSSFAPARIVAYRWLRQWKPDVALSLAEQLIEQSDSTLRQEVVLVLDRDDAHESLRMLGRMLGDRNPTVRQTVRDIMIKKAKITELRPIVDEILDQYLSKTGFEGLEQASFIIERLGAREYVPKLIPVLEHSRQEAAIPAAWALQNLAEEQEDLAAIHKHCLEWTNRLEQDKPVTDDDVMRISFLFQALGHNRYQPADEMLRRYIPKNSQKMRPNTRVAAIWALGEIWTGRHDSGLEQPLIERIMDMAIINPEDGIVKYVAVIALGKFGNPESISALESAPFYEGTAGDKAAKWSLKQFEAAGLK